MTAIDLRLGRWQDALADVGEVDVLMTDPPYSARTDKGYRSALDYGKFASRDDRARVASNARSQRVYGRANLHTIPRSRFELPYAPITEDWVRAFAAFWVPRVREFFVVFGDHVSQRWYDAAFAQHDLVTFAPVPWVRTNSAPRFAGDGPANACEWLTIARHRGLPRSRGSRPGYYMTQIAQAGFCGTGQVVTGGKPLHLMQALVRDYSRPGDLICDPCAGGGTTLLAAAIEGRRAIGAEMDPATHAKAIKRIARGYTPTMFTDAPRAVAHQTAMFGDGDGGGGGSEVKP